MLYGLAHRLVSWMARVFFRLRVEGLQNVPPEGPLIIASNHASHLDIPLLGCSLSRKVHFVGKSELFKIPVLGFLFRQLGGIPLKREGIDRQAMAKIETHLREGHVLVVYPEGRRTTTGSLQRPKAGIGMIAAKTRAPVVPAYIEGTYHVLPKGKKWFRMAPVRIRFGPPVPLLPEGNGSSGGRTDYQAVADRIMNEISALAREKDENGRLGPPAVLPRKPQNPNPW